MVIRERDPESGPTAPTGMTSRLLIALEPGLNKSSALTSVSDTITRLQQERDHLQKERDLALRRQRELHDFYLAKIKGWETDSSHLSISIWTLDRDGNK